MFEDRKSFSGAVREIILRDILGQGTDSFNIDTLAFLAAGISSSNYAQQHMQRAKRLANNFELLSFAASIAPTQGLVLEFGVFSGRTINHIAGCFAGRQIYGFDSFEGLPETWRPGFEAGAFRAPMIPHVASNVALIRGWFDRTLPTFCDEHKEDVAFLHIDCDIYSSTQTVLQQLKGRIRPGAVIVFDEYFNYPGWESHEFKAFGEYVASGRIHYDYIGLVPGHQQVAVRIIGT